MEIKRKTRIFDLPDGFIGGFYIELFSDSEAVLTGDFEIAELSDSVLKIKCKEHLISICGNKLKIVDYSSTGIRIDGIIEEIMFSKRGVNYKQL